MELPNTGMISARDAARMLGVTLGRVRQLLKAKKLRGRKLTPRAWAIYKITVLAYKRSDRRRGPKTSRPAA